MARISKKSLTSQQESDLTHQLSEVIGQLQSENAQRFLEEFFGQEEKIMLAKRLAIIVLLSEGRPIHRIATHLHVSESTVAKLHERYERNEYEHTIAILNKNKKRYIDFVAVLDAILTVGGIMPHHNYVMKQRR